MPTKITVTIDTNGIVKKTVQGIDGPACFDSALSKKLDNALGPQNRTEQTPEYYAHCQTDQSQYTE